MRTIEEQHKLLEELLETARQRKSAGETEWMEFKTNIGESHCSVTYEGVGNYISGLSNSACLKYKSHGYLTNLSSFIPNSVKNVLMNDAPTEHYRNRFLAKLPEALTDKQKLYKIGNLLAALRSSGKIVFGEKKLWRRK